MREITSILVKGYLSSRTHLKQVYYQNDKYTATVTVQHT
jgi:hypothetical protein